MKCEAIPGSYVNSHILENIADSEAIQHMPPERNMELGGNLICFLLVGLTFAKFRKSQ